MSKCCSKCRIEKPQTTEYFGKNNSVPCGLSSWCRECTRNAIKEWAKTPKGKKIKYHHSSKWRNAKQGIYGIFEDNKCLYVGESSSLKYRLSFHKSAIKNPLMVKYQRELYYNLQQHLNIDFRILEETKRHKELEGYYIDIYKPLYNTVNNGIRE
jgi:CMP-N-acetylneuraminic acid synthetase